MKKKKKEEPKPDPMIQYSEHLTEAEIEKIRNEDKGTEDEEEQLDWSWSIR